MVWWIAHSRYEHRKGLMAGKNDSKFGKLSGYYTDIGESDAVKIKRKAGFVPRLSDCLLYLLLTDCIRRS